MRRNRLLIGGLALLLSAGHAPADEPADDSDTKNVPVIPVSPESIPEPRKAEPQVLEDIVVTANKRTESARDLPGSVSAISGRELEEMRASALRDYLKLIPGVSFNDQGNDASVPIIRGIASEIGFSAIAQTTGAFLDDMPFTDLFVPLSLPDLYPFDLERVEVLKGPQGTLFGSGALAGAVRYVTRKPQPGIWDTRFLATVANTQEGSNLAHVNAAALNVPLFGNSAAIRLVGSQRKGGNLYDMSASDSSGNSLRNEPDADRLRQSTGRMLASWNPSEALHVSGLFLAQRTHQDDVSLADQQQEPKASAVPFASPRDHDFSGGNVLISYDLGWGTLLSSTNRMTKHNDHLTHAEWFFDLQDQNQSQWYDKTISNVKGLTQEVRLQSPDDTASSWTWLAGASYLRYDDDFFEYEPNPGPQSRPPPGSPDDLSTQERAQSFLFASIEADAREAALFGEATRRFGPHWEVTVGARRYKTRLIADTVLSGSQVAALVQQPEDRRHFEPDSSGTNPKLAVRYLVSPDIQLYALACRGYQFGGVQLNPSSPLLVQSAAQAGFEFGPYDSSLLWNYETGVRTQWLDGRLRLDVAAFYLDWRDVQLNVRAPIMGTNATFNVIANVGRAHSQGAEAALEIVPFHGARWTSAAAWIHAATDVPFDEDNAAGPVPAGTRLPGTPRVHYTSLFRYEHAVPYFENWAFGPVVTYTHIGASPDAIRPTGTVGGYGTLDARIAFSREESRFAPEVTIGLTNAMDVRGVTYHSRNQSVPTGTPRHFYHFLESRTVLATVGFRY